MNARRAALTLTLLILALGGAIGLAAGPAEAASHHHVVIRQYAYSPAALTIEAGDTVTWTNEDSVGHDVAVTRGPQTFRSPMLAKGQSWSHTFTSAGSYSYICSVHPDMKASVSVRKPAVASAPAAPVPAATKQATKQTTKQATQEVTAPASKAPVTHATNTPTSAGAPAVAAPAVQQAVVAGSGATLDPLLVVAGISAAVTIFCLLLLTGRPAAAAVPAAPVQAEVTEAD